MSGEVDDVANTNDRSRFHIEKRPPDDYDLMAMVRLLDEELWQRYPDEFSGYQQYNQLDDIEVCLVAFHDALPVGCGCFKRYDAETVELKRMFVHADHRGSGVAKMLMDSLEDWAGRLGYSGAVLETGVRNPDAQRFYEKCGYRRIPNYDQYVGLELSLCYAREF